MRGGKRPRMAGSAPRMSGSGAKRQPHEVLDVDDAHMAKVEKLKEQAKYGMTMQEYKKVFCIMANMKAVFACLKEIDLNTCASFQVAERLRSAEEQKKVMSMLTLLEVLTFGIAIWATKSEPYKNLLVQIYDHEEKWLWDQKEGLEERIKSFVRKCKLEKYQTFADHLYESVLKRITAMDSNVYTLNTFMFMKPMTKRHDGIAEMYDSWDLDDMPNFANNMNVFIKTYAACIAKFRQRQQDEREAEAKEGSSRKAKDSSKDAEISESSEDDNMQDAGHVPAVGIGNRIGNPRPPDMLRRMRVDLEALYRNALEFNCAVLPVVPSGSTMQKGISADSVRKQKGLDGLMNARLIWQLMMFGNQKKWAMLEPGMPAETKETRVELQESCVKLFFAFQHFVPAILSVLWFGISENYVDEERDKIIHEFVEVCANGSEKDHMRLMRLLVGNENGEMVQGLDTVIRHIDLSPLCALELGEDAMHFLPKTGECSREAIVAMEQSSQSIQGAERVERYVRVHTACMQAVLDVGSKKHGVGGLEMQVSSMLAVARFFIAEECSLMAFANDPKSAWHAKSIAMLTRFVGLEWRRGIEECERKVPSAVTIMQQLHAKMRDAHKTERNGGPEYFYFARIFPLQYVSGLCKSMCMTFDQENMKEFKRIDEQKEQMSNLSVREQTAHEAKFYAILERETKKYINEQRLDSERASSNIERVLWEGLFIGASTFKLGMPGRKKPLSFGKYNLFEYDGNIMDVFDRVTYTTREDIPSLPQYMLVDFALRHFSVALEHNITAYELYVSSVGCAHQSEENWEQEPSLRSALEGSSSGGAKGKKRMR